MKLNNESTTKTFVNGKLVKEIDANGKVIFPKPPKTKKK